MYQAKLLRAADTTAYPKQSKPITGRPVTMIAYRSTPITDGTKFQWQFQTNSAGDFNDIPGANSWKYEIPSYQVANKGSYKCNITFTDGTTALTTNAVVLGDPVVEAVGTNRDKYHSAPKRYLGPWYRTHIHWKEIEAVNTLALNPANDTAVKFQAALALDAKLSHIYDLLMRYGYIQMIDSRNGYSYFLSELTTGPAGGVGGGLSVEGPFKNFWAPAP